MKKAGQILSTVVIVILIICIALVLIPKIFGVQFFAVKSGSMEPDLPVYSLVVVVPTEYEDIKIGDDISFVRDKQLTVVTHRVIEKNDAEEELTTQGIANNVPDSPTIYENVIGVVRFHLPFVGYIFKCIDTLQGKIIAITIILALLIISLLIGKIVPKKKQDIYKQK